MPSPPLAALATLMALATLLAAAPVTADRATGRGIAAEQCQPCHGIDGIALIPEAPNLAGQNRAYLARQLWAFRAGERSDQKMSPAARGLSDDDIIAVADWYSSIAITVTPPE